ncbi:hypothetical protein FBQ82_18820 [Anaerolineae bacterium CFX7]|nr:hypothetical protein [Anaerolineae bacterium CFX7]
MLCYHVFVKRFWKLAPFAILLLGFALRLYRLGVNSLWYDETVSVVLAQSELGELIRHTAGDIHPPLYYLLLHFWGRLAGWSEFAMAFVSLWFGVLLIALVYRVARDWLQSRNIAMLAALWVAISPYNIWYSQEVRMYTLGATLGLLSVYFLRRMLAREKIFSRDFFAYVIFTVLGFYTLYYFVFLMLFEYVWVATQLVQIKNRKSKIKNFLASQLALLLLYLPWLPIAFRQATDPPVPPWREFIALPRVILGTFSALAFGQAVDWNVFGFAALLLIIPIGALLWREWKSSRASALENDPYAPPQIENRKSKIENSALENASYAPPQIENQKSKTENSALENAPYAHSQTENPALENAPYAHPSIENQKSKTENQISPFFLLGYFVIPLASIYAFSLWKPLYHVRYMFTYSPAFYILGAWALVNLVNEFRNAARATTPRWVYGLGALAMLAGIGFLSATGYSLDNFWHNEQYAEDDLRGAVNYIAERWRPGDVILVNAGYAYPALAYYFPETIARERLTNYRGAETASPLVLQTGSIGGAKNLGWGDPQSDFYATTADETRAALDRVFADAPRVWMLRIYDTVTDPQGDIRKYFAEHATLLDDQAFGGESQARVQGFITQPTRELPPSATPVNQNLGERVELVGYETGARELERAQFFDAVLYWKLLQPVNYNYQVTLQLLNAQGENVAQTDETPLSELLPMTRWQTDELYREPLRLKIPDALAPGAYRAIVKLYNPRSGEVLGEVIDLGTVRMSE